MICDPVDIEAIVSSATTAIFSVQGSSLEIPSAAHSSCISDAASSARTCSSIWPPRGSCSGDSVGDWLDVLCWFIALVPLT